MDQLFTTTDATPVQGGFDFPVSLAERYRPQTVDEFIGLERVKRIASNLIAHPRESAFLFVGPSGVGKTTMGLAIAASIPAELHKIPSQECNLANIERVRAVCQYVPMLPYKWHCVLADEIDQLTAAAQISLLSKLDSTNFFPSTVFIGTCNATDRLEPRFLSRFQVIDFSSYGLAAPLAELLRNVWAENAPQDAPSPNFQRLAKDAANNVRAALMALETELMCC